MIRVLLVISLIPFIGVLMGTTTMAEEKDEKAKVELATFAGGCFWCMQPPFDKLPGVISTEVGYTGGPEEDPSYNQVASGKTGHTEAVQIKFDPKKLSYKKLLQVFWRNIDPTDPNGQFCDRGQQYRTGIFYHSAEQREAAVNSKREILDSKTVPKIVTEISEYNRFYRAEEYHQSFYKKNPTRYYSYRRGCRRDDRLKQLWSSAVN